MMDSKFEEIKKRWQAQNDNPGKEGHEYHEQFWLHGTDDVEWLIREIELLHAAADRQDMYARGLIRRLQKFTGSSDP